MSGLSNQHRTEVRRPAGSRLWWALPVLLAALACAAFAGTGAAAAAGLTRGVIPGSSQGRWLDQAVRSKSELVLYFVNWRGIAGTKPADPRNPADPAYDFASLDAAVRAAASRGLEVVLPITNAPRWAEGADSPPWAPSGTWKPSPSAFGDFGAALARRYSGTFITVGGVLPAVTYFEAWSEPNLTELLTPQFEGDKPAVVQDYRRMLNAFYGGVHAGNPQAKVIAPGLAPYGDDPPNSGRTRPLLFLRKLLCLRERDGHRLVPRDCPDPARFDIFSHHPINTTAGPHDSAGHPDDVSTPDVKHMVRALRIAERRGTVAPGGQRRPVWATELWWETDPPDRVLGFPMQNVEGWVAESLQVLWKRGVSVMIWAQLVDDALGPGGSGYQNGFFFINGNEKPLFQAWRFPFVAKRTSRRNVHFWVLAPGSGEVSIERRRAGGWQTIKRLQTTDGVPLEFDVGFPGKATLRARFGNEASLPRNVGRKNPSH